MASFQTSHLFLQIYLLFLGRVPIVISNFAFILLQTALFQK